MSAETIRLSISLRLAADFINSKCIKDKECWYLNSYLTFCGQVGVFWVRFVAFLV